MFKDTPDGQTNYCKHETANPSGICDACLGQTIKRWDVEIAEQYKCNIQDFITKEDEMFDKEFPRLIMSINKSQMGFRDERGEADEKVMKAFHKASKIRLLERVLEEIKTGVEEYKMSKIVGNMAGDYIFTYDLEKFVLESLLNKYITQLK